MLLLHIREPGELAELHVVVLLGVGRSGPLIFCGLLSTIVDDVVIDVVVVDLPIERVLLPILLCILVDVDLGTVVDGGVGDMAADVVDNVGHIFAILRRLLGRLLPFLLLGSGSLSCTAVGRVGGTWIILKDYLTPIYS